MCKDYGVFIGLSCVPSYSNLSFKFNDFISKNLNLCFEGYKDSLNKYISSSLDPDLYKPIHFSALGNFDHISLCLIDDYYFGNFHFRPYSRFIVDNPNATNFQFQVINAIRNEYFRLRSLREIDKFNFIGVCKFKINYDLIKNNDYEIFSKIKKYLINYLENNTECSCIVSESFSWHEYTIIFANNEMSKIINIISQLRKFSNIELIKFDSSINFGKADSIQHVFVDSHTTYGINNLLFDPHSIEYNKYIKSNYDATINIISKLQIKTGHGNHIKEILNSVLPKLSFKPRIKFSDGRSDYSVNHKNIKSYLNFWISLINNRNNCSNLFLHIRKIHSNINADNNKFSLSLLIKNNLGMGKSLLAKGPTINTDNNKKITNTSQFSIDSILNIEQNLKLINVSKELSNNIISAYTCFNDLATDVTLFQYILDLKPLLINLESIISKLANAPNTNYEYKNSHEFNTVKEASKVLFNYIDIWQLAFQNRFQESKRYGYNSDSKVEFNGGVHKLIQSFDLVYKLVVRIFQIPEFSNSDYLPVATYGSHRIDISSTLNNLHINYIQLFQPEIFLAVLPKEALNQQLHRYYFDEGSEFRTKVIDPLIKVSRDLSIKIHEENNTVIKQRIFEFCTPENLKLRTNYIVTYYMWAKLVFGKENIYTFTKWFWLIYLQTSENYNIDGSFRIAILRRTFFDFSFIVLLIDSNFNLSFISEIINDKAFNFLITSKDNYKKISLINECKELIDYFKGNSMKYNDSNSIAYKLRRILIDLEYYADKLLKEENIKSFLQEFKTLSVEILNKYSDIIFDGNKINTLMRNKENGKIVKSQDYGQILIDPHGGLFICNSHDLI